MKKFYHKLEGDEVKEEPVPEDLKTKQVLEDDEIKQFIDYVNIYEDLMECPKDHTFFEYLNKKSIIAWFQA